MNKYHQKLITYRRFQRNCEFTILQKNFLNIDIVIYKAQKILAYPSVTANLTTKALANSKLLITLKKFT